jgi:thiol-disulfide isomerase/thioredoxin
MTEIIIVLSALLIVLGLIRHYGAMQEGFTGSSSGAKERLVVICKADWCGHCKKAAPEFQKLVAASPITLKDGSKVTVKVLDADKDKSEIAKYKPRGFPTILIVDGDNTTEYPGDRTYSGVIDFLNSNY